MTEHNEVQVNIEPVGPGPEVIDEVSQALSEHASVQERLSETRSRLLSVELQPAMPPLITEPTRPNGCMERTLAVLLLSRSDEARNEVVGVNMIGRTVLRFPDRAPTAALASEATCGIPDAVNQFPTPRGWLGQYRVTIMQGGTTLWRFLVFRPSYSRGTNGSGVTLL